MGELSSFSIFAVILLSSYCYPYDFPEGVKKCNVGDTNCIRTTINSILRNLPKGAPGINLVSIDPLSISGFDIDPCPGTAIHIKLAFTHATVKNLQNFICTKVRGFQKSPEGEYELEFNGPSLVITGNQTVEGRISFLPVTGHGDGSITIENPVVKIKFNGTSITKDDKKILRAEDLHLEFTTSKFILYFHKLYNDNNQLNDEINRLLSENNKDILGRLQDPLSEILGEFFQKILNNVFETIPYQELFTQ